MIFRLFNILLLLCTSLCAVMVCWFASVFMMWHPRYIPAIPFVVIVSVYVAFLSAKTFDEQVQAEIEIWKNK